MPPTLEEQLAAERRRRTLEEAAASQVKRNAGRFSDQQLEEGLRRQRSSEMSWGDWAKDVDRSATRGVMRGVAALPGAPADAYRLGQLAKAYTTTKFTSDPKYFGKSTEDVLAMQDAEREAGGGALKPSNVKKWSGGAFIDLAEKYAPDKRLSYQPQTPAGETASRGAEIVGGAATGGGLSGLRGGLGGVARGTQAGARAGVGAAAGQAAAEAAGLGPGWQTAASLAGGAAAARYGSTTAAEAIQRGAGNATQQQVQQAQALVAAAQREGVALTVANALDWVTGGNSQGLSELQRVVESSGSPQLRQFFADAAPPGPTRARAFIERRLDDVGPESRTPSTIGPRVAEAQQRVISNAEANANQAVRPQYQQFEGAPVDPQIYAAQMADRHWAATAEEVANSTRYASYLQRMPPGSVGFMDLVNRVIRDERSELLRPTAVAGMKPTAAEGIRPSQESGQAAANAASFQAPPGGIPPGQMSPLEQAQQQRAIRQTQDIDPLVQGPEGGMARAATTEAAQAAAFPAKPLEGSHIEVGRAIGNLAQQDEGLAREFVRNHLGTEFEQATGRNLPGEPYSAGGKFWKTIAGTGQQAQNVQAMLEALPNGQQLWQGWREMGNIFEAMGKRQAPGSKTAFNEDQLSNLKGQGFDDATIKLMGSGLTALPTMAREAVERWRLGANMQEIASLVTDPARGAEFAQILSETRPGSAERVFRFGQFLAGAAQQAAQPAVTDPLAQPPGAP